MKNNLISEFSSFSTTISCTTNLWTDHNKLSFICVTAHFIDSSWVLHKKIIAFRMIEYPNSTTHIFQCIMTILKEYEVIDKIFSITFDNHIANNATIEMFTHNLHPSHSGQFFHGKCVCHIINLIMQDSLKLIEEHIEKIRYAILFITSSPISQQEFFHLCKTYGLNPRKFKSDIKTRWNSTFLMLQSCVKHHEVITNFINAKYDDTILSTNNWDLAFIFLEFLEVFYNATNICSRVYYPTSCIDLNQLYNISNIFSTYRENVIFANICKVMEEKFIKYWEHIPPIFCLATVMDPRIKLFGVELLLNGISKNLNTSLHITIDDVNISLTSIYKTYESKYANNTRNTLSLSSSNSDPASSLLAEYRKQMSSVNSSSRTELHKYLETNFTDLFTNEEIENFDILKWWKTYERFFSVLSIMAHDLLTLPAFTVALESAFSAGNKVLNEKRSRLTPEILDCLTCMKDWEDARLRSQSWKDDMVEDFENLDICNGSKD
uniref:Zinc finger BED domain-containing protein RICESLEEPER 2-like n=1 Tax=Davidia involucrata TaxID=16924 RepID=A0A5B7AEL5_DAVIN